MVKVSFMLWVTYQKKNTHLKTKNKQHKTGLPYFQVFRYLRKTRTGGRPQTFSVGIVVVTIALVNKNWDPAAASG